MPHLSLRALPFLALAWLSLVACVPQEHIGPDAIADVERRFQWVPKSTTDARSMYQSDHPDFSDFEATLTVDSREDALDWLARVKCWGLHDITTPQVDERLWLQRHCSTCNNGSWWRARVSLDDGPTVIDIQEHGSQH